MIGTEIDARDGEELVRFVRALGKHRYVASRLHLVHAFAIEAAGDAPALGEARAWAAAVLADPSVDRDSKDPRLLRCASDDELVAVLGAFFGDERAAAAGRLDAHLDAIGAARDPDAPPFDESREDDVYPVLVDAGWELCALAKLDAERHRGAIEAHGDELAWQIAKFEEENAVPPTVTLHELPVFGPTELTRALADDGTLRAPFVLWATGHEVYLDYVLRGVLRAARLER